MAKPAAGWQAHRRGDRLPDQGGHTFMSAEALETMAKQLGHQIRVETQGSVGAQNALTADERLPPPIWCSLATDIGRWTWPARRRKPVYRTSTGGPEEDPRRARQGLDRGKPIATAAAANPRKKGRRRGPCEAPC